MLGRWHAGWKGTASRSIEKVLRHFEIVGDPQTLASMVCVLASASKDGGYGTLLPGGSDNASKYDRYLTSYAEQLYQWSAHGVRTEIISHVRGGENPPSSNDTATLAPVCQGVKVNHSNSCLQIPQFLPTCRKLTCKNIENLFIDLIELASAIPSSYSTFCHSFMLQLALSPARLHTDASYFCDGLCISIHFQEEGRLRCSLCGKLVGLAAPKCMLCGHGGHVLHMKVSS